MFKIIGSILVFVFSLKFLAGLVAGVLLHVPLKNIAIFIVSEIKKLFGKKPVAPVPGSGK